MEYSINGSFAVLQFNGRYPFIKRSDNGLWELVGGGFNINEIDYKSVLIREILEEMGITISEKKLQLCAILGQALKAETSAHLSGVKYGFAYLHCYIHYGEQPVITLSDEHTEYRYFTYEEIIAEWKTFSSGPLWMFFTYLTFHQTKKVQEGLLSNRKLWQGKQYFKQAVA